jgi:hypothetical protein
MGDVHYIVDKLNEAPFNMGVTLISFRQGPVHLSHLYSRTHRCRPAVEPYNNNVVLVL